MTTAWKLKIARSVNSAFGLFFLLHQFINTESAQLGNATQFHLIGFSHHPSPNKHLKERVSSFTYSTSLQQHSNMAVAFSKRSQKTEGDSARINILNDA